MNRDIMKQSVITALIAVLMTSSAYAQYDTAKETASGTVGNIKLKSNLDRPSDGFCIDVIGFSPYERLDLPLIAHNCKSGLYNDQAMSVLNNGQIYLPAYDKCVTAIAPHTRALPGSSLMARDCGEHSNFLQAAPLQLFNWLNGRITLRNSDLCITAGERSDQTPSSLHRWRALTLQICNNTPSERIEWHFVAGIIEK